MQRESEAVEALGDARSAEEEKKSALNAALAAGPGEHVQIVLNNRLMMDNRLMMTPLQ